MKIDHLAEWISEDGEVVAESLFGYNVTPGDSPIDRLIAKVDTQWLDWNPKDPKFIAAVEEVFGKMPSGSEWQHLINGSSQSEPLKKKLIELLKIEPQAAPTDEPDSYVVTSRGNKIPFVEMAESGPASYSFLLDKPSNTDYEAIYFRPRVGPFNHRTVIWPGAGRNARGYYKITARGKIISMHKNNVKELVHHGQKVV